VKKKTIRGYKVRIYPTNKQAELINKTFGCVRLVWNYSLMERNAIYELFSQYPELLRSHKYKRQKDWKKHFPFLKEVDSQALDTVYQELQQAYKNYFNKSHQAPKYKSKKNPRRSYTTHTTNHNIRIDHNRVKLPKIGWVKLKKQRKKLPAGAIIKAATVSSTPSGKYYVSLRVEYEQEMIKRNNSFNEAIGLDFSTTHFFIDSCGKKANYPRHIEKTLEKIKTYQRKMSRQIKGSNRRERTRLYIAKLYEKKNNQLKDFHHKTANTLIKRYDIIGVESLSLKEMDKQKYYRQQIQKMGYRRFIDILTYKCEDNGVLLHKVHKYYPSSKTCSVCGAIKKTFPLSQKTYTCDCGNVMHRDINAAINIATQSLKQYYINYIEDRTASIAWSSCEH
jgi:putative transposase